MKRRPNPFRLSRKVARAWGVDAGYMGASMVPVNRPRLRVTSDKFREVAEEFGREGAESIGGFNPIRYDLDKAGEYAWDEFDEGVREGVQKWLEENYPLWFAPRKANPRQTGSRRVSPHQSRRPASRRSNPPTTLRWQTQRLSAAGYSATTEEAKAGGTTYTLYRADGIGGGMVMVKRGDHLAYLAVGGREVQRVQGFGTVAAAKRAAQDHARARTR